MELHGHFRYGSFSSRDYGLILAHADTSHDNRISGDIQTVNLFSKRGKRNVFTRDDYSDSPISFDVEILSDSDEPLDQETQRTVQKWLFYQQGHWPLYIDPFDDCAGDNTELIDGEEKRLYIKCRFTNPEKVYGNGGVFGYKATLEADSPLAWQDATVKTFPMDGGSDANTLISLEIDTDMKDYTYPKVTITTGSSGGDITIVNNTDSVSRLTSFHGLGANTQIIMNEKIGMVSGQNYEKFSHKNFIRLLDGENKFSILGDVVSVKFEWQNRRFL